MSGEREIEANPSGQGEPPPQDQGRNRKQLPVLVALVTLAGLWLACGFLLELAWAVTIATALWPLYRRATSGRKARRSLVAFGFTLAAALVLMLPIAIVAIEAARESEQATQ